MRRLRRCCVLFCTLILMLIPGMVQATSLQVIWNANDESDLAGYIVSYGISSNVYDTTVDVGNVTSYIIPDVAEGYNYYIVVQAYNTSNQISVPSDEIRVPIPVEDTQAPTGSISINSGAESTTSRVVTLNLSATDESGSITGMQFSSDGSSWGDIYTYATSQAWTLETGDGVKSVYVRYIDDSNNVSAAYSDSITLVLDTDGDGLSDAYEDANDLDSTDAGDANIDSDGDGYTNAEESAMGTDPQDSFSQAITVSAGSNQSSNPDRVYLYGTATDITASSLGYSWRQDSGPALVTIQDATSATANFLGVSAGTYSFIFTAYNSRSSASSSVDVTINNVAPRVSVSDNVTIDTGESVTLQATGSDANDDTLAYSWGLISGPSVRLPDMDTQKITIVPYNVGSYVFQVQCSDGSLKSEFATVTVTANKGNSAPTANAGSDLTAQYGDVVSLDGSASSDPDGDTLSYTWSQVSGPSVTLSNAHVASPSFTAEATGTLVFELSVSDGELSSTADSVSVTVVNMNNAPIADAGDDFTVEVGNSVELDGTHSYDPDGDTITYSWMQTSGAQVTLSGSTTANPYFTPTVAGTLEFTLTVSDGQATDMAIVQITANSENHVPVADAGDGFAATVGETVTLDGSGSYDSDGDPITYSWSQSSGTNVSLSDPNSVKPSFIPKDIGTYLFSLKVSDGEATSSANSVSISVQEGEASIQPLSPANGATVSYTPTMSWSAPGFTRFSLYIKLDNGRYMRLYYGSSTSYRFSSVIWRFFVASGSTLSWYVDGYKDDGEKATSAVFTFVRK